MLTHILPTLKSVPSLRLVITIIIAALCTVFLPFLPSSADKSSSSCFIPLFFESGIKALATFRWATKEDCSWVSDCCAGQRPRRCLAQVTVTVCMTWNNSKQHLLLTVADIEFPTYVPLILSTYFYHKLFILLLSMQISLLYVTCLDLFIFYCKTNWVFDVCWALQTSGCLTYWFNKHWLRDVLLSCCWDFLSELLPQTNLFIPPLQYIYIYALCIRLPNNS